MAQLPLNSARSGNAHRWLVVVCVGIYAVQLLTASGGPRGDGWFTEALVLDTARVLQGQVWRLVSYAFLHSPSDPLHLALNMAFLWVFGSVAEKRLGSEMFWCFCLGAAAFGGSIFGLEALIAGPDRAYGASGVVMALMVLCVLQSPYGMLDFAGAFRIPIWIFAALNLGKDLISVWLEARWQMFSNMALGVHVGGALFAVLCFYAGVVVASWSRRPGALESQPSTESSDANSTRPT